MDKDKKIIVVGLPTIEINGKTYEQIIEKKTNSKASKLAMMASMMSGMMLGGNSYQRQLPSNIDIIEEFGKIERKESNLTKWERDKVVYIFNKNFKLLNKSKHETI